MLKGNHDKPPDFKGILFPESFIMSWFLLTPGSEFQSVHEDLYAAMKNHLSQGVKAETSQPGLKTKVIPFGKINSSTLKHT
jgi:hypothetical protein